LFRVFEPPLLIPGILQNADSPPAGLAGWEISTICLVKKSLRGDPGSD
jgi:hypothetical protein